MTEEERRRCIILGICGGAGLAAGDGSERRAALFESLTALGVKADLSQEAADYVLGLIDEALAAAGD